MMVHVVVVQVTACIHHDRSPDTVRNCPLLPLPLTDLFMRYVWYTKVLGDTYEIKARAAH